MDFNVVVLSGMLAAPTDLGAEATESTSPAQLGFAAATARSARLLLTVRSREPMPRIDLLPIAAHVAQIPADLTPGEGLWVTGSLQRQFNSTSGRSRLVVMAHHIERADDSQSCDAPAAD